MNSCPPAIAFANGDYRENRSSGLTASVRNSTDVSESPPRRILLVDDHGLVREALSILLEREEGMKVVGSVATGEEAVLAARRLRPDVIIMDLVLPHLNGIDATQHILGEFPMMRVIVLSACHTPEHVCRALRAGAQGYVVKAASGAELICAVNAVSAGHQFVSPTITSLFTDGVLDVSVPKSSFERLSMREREVLGHIVAGLSNADIAQQLGVSPKTIDTYRGRLMVKLGVSNRSALIRLAIEHELPIP
jgi:DNA-binding NarL/FixJ family response regulator